MFLAMPIRTSSLRKRGAGWPVEARSAEPVLPRQFRGVLHTQSALLRGVDEEQPAEGPPRLAAQGLLRLLVEEQDCAPGTGLTAAAARPVSPAPPRPAPPR